MYLLDYVHAVISNSLYPYTYVHTIHLLVSMYLYLYIRMYVCVIVCIKVPVLSCKLWRVPYDCVFVAFVWVGTRPCPHKSHKDTIIWNSKTFCTVRLHWYFDLLCDFFPLFEL